MSSTLGKKWLKDIGKDSSILHSLPLVEVVAFLSGAAALVYEMVWHRYLTVLMGAQVTATSSILGIFLLGLGLGYIIFGQIADRIPGKRLRLFCYVEFAIAIFGVCFPWVFHGVFNGMSRAYAFFGIESRLLDLLVVSFLILPQSLLMGATLPLLTTGIGGTQKTVGRFHARVYGFNTVGAFLGAILATFLLIPVLGLRHALFVAASLNLIAGLLAHRYLIEGNPSPSSEERIDTLGGEVERREKGPNVRKWLVLMFVSFSSGYFILSLENILIRYLSLSVGPNDTVFGTVVAAFVLGLGFGGIRASAYETVKWQRLASNIFWTLLLFLVLIATVGWWPYAHHLYRIIFQSSAENYAIYQGGLVLVVMGACFFPAFISGFTLPLVFNISAQYSECVGRRVGWIYSVNTLGCLVGALLGAHIFLKFLSLLDCVRVSAALLFISGIFVFSESLRPRPVKRSMGCVLLIILCTGLWWKLSTPEGRYFAQVYRLTQPVPASYSGREEFTQALTKNIHFLFHKDGPDSTISLLGYRAPGKQEQGLSVLVNGKSDGDTVGDRFTMEMTAHLPALLSEGISKALVIGLGTGLTVDALRTHSGVKEVDVAEISHTLLSARQFLDPFNHQISSDQRIQYLNMDALRLLEGTNKKYELIISEPSNPWMTGVENLYSQEYYRLARSRLQGRGMLAQWLQAYSFDPSLFKMVLRTLNDVFPFVTVWQMRDYDLLILATDHPLDLSHANRAQSGVLGNPVVMNRLGKLGIQSIESLLALQVMTERVSREVSDGADLHTLERPRLGVGAKRALFAGKNVSSRDLARSTGAYFWGEGDFLLSQYSKGNTLSEAAIRSIIHLACENEVSLSQMMCKSSLSQAYLTYPHLGDEIQPDGIFSVKDKRMMEAFRRPETHALTSSEAFTYFQQNFSPIYRVPIKPIEIAIRRCLLQEDIRSREYGSCLLHKAALYEATQPKSIEFVTTAKQYSDWVQKYGTASLAPALILPN